MTIKLTVYIGSRIEILHASNFNQVGDNLLAFYDADGKLIGIFCITNIAGIKLDYEYSNTQTTNPDESVK